MSLRRLAAGAALVIVAGSAPAIAADNPSVDLNAAPSTRPAAGPERAAAGGARPESGDDLQAGPPFDRVNGIWRTKTTKAVLRNTVTDPDGDRSNLTFEVWTTDANGNPKDQVDLGGDYGVLVSDYVDSGEFAEVTVPYGKLKPGRTYTFRTSAYDGGLYETDWSPWEKFRIRGRAVDITLPEPDKTAPKVNLADYQEPEVASRNMTGLAGQQDNAKSDSASKDENCTNVGHGKIVCMEIGKPGDLTKKQQALVEKRLHGTRAAAADDLVDWCDGLLTGKDYFKRTEACMKKATPLRFRYTEIRNGVPVFVGEATFASEIQLKLDPQSTTFQQRFWLVPVEFKDAAGGRSEWGPLTMEPIFSCNPQCSTSAPQWTGTPTWSTTGSDMHTAYATFTHTASGTNTTDVASVQMVWKFEGSVPGGKQDIQGDMGTSTPDLDVRCDKVVSTTKPGCVFSTYKPTWVMNFKKYPAAVAHAWLIQFKLPSHPGSKAANKPMVFLPKAEKNASGRDPDDNRAVICPDGWAAQHGNPDTTAVTEISSRDVASCDEFAYAASYNSGGMPASMGGLNEVSTGDECVQTYATRVTQGEWHLYDDARIPGPQWDEVCGRSSMSRWMNSGSMAGFPGNFSAAGKYRLLDQDEYWVAFPEFAHCTSPRGCTVPKP